MQLLLDTRSVLWFTDDGDARHAQQRTRSCCEGYSSQYAHHDLPKSG